jgi:hypothetical protein
MYKHEFALPKTDIDWSIPPDAVPVYLYPTITVSIKSSFLPSFSCFSSPELACIEAKAEQTHKAEELDNPAAGGMFPEIITCIPRSSIFMSFTPAL